MLKCCILHTVQLNYKVYLYCFSFFFFLQIKDSLSCKKKKGKKEKWVIVCKYFTKK